MKGEKKIFMLVLPVCNKQRDWVWVGVNMYELNRSASKKFDGY